MPIEKTSPTLLKHQGGTYVVIPSETVHAINDAVSLAILVYLLDKPNDWTIHREDIRKRFSIGKDRYAKAMRELNSLGLIWREQVRDEAGQIVSNHLCLRATVMPENPSDRKTGHSGKPEARENPNVGKSGHLHITDLPTDNRDGPAEETAGPRRLRPDWYPSDQLLERAVELGMQFDDFDSIVAEFRDYWISTGKRRKLAGWDRTFMNRLKAITEKQKGHSNGKAPTSTDLLAADLKEQLELA